MAVKLRLGIYCDLGNRRGEANALLGLGVARRLMGDFPGAARDLEQALGVYRDLGGRLGEAEVLNEAGRCNGSAATSPMPRYAIIRPWNWPAPSSAPGTRPTRWPT